MIKDKIANGTEVGILCPRHEIPLKMIVRTSRRNGNQFLGCPKWPRCSFTQKLPIDIALRLLGAPSLPGFSEEELK